MRNRNANGLFTVAKVSTKVVNLFFFTLCLNTVTRRICSITSNLSNPEALLRANESVQLHRQVCRCNDLASSKLVRETIRECALLPNFYKNFASRIFIFVSKNFYLPSLT